MTYSSFPKINVLKASGDVVPFIPDKLTSSLMRAGASSETAHLILDALSTQLYDEIPTKQIYKLAFKLLKKQEKSTAIRYRIKQAIMELGPSGYPFERYVGELFKFQGYTVEIGQLVKGFSVSHEIDVLAENGHRKIIAECKFHNRQGTKSDVKVPMYFLSRVKDVKKAWLENNYIPLKKQEGWLITNTHFTTDAIKFGGDYGLRLIAWDYPKKGNLKDWITAGALHPITCLTSLTRAEKNLILKEGVVLCTELYQNRGLLDKLPIKQAHRRAAVRELILLMEE